MSNGKQYAVVVSIEVGEGFSASFNELSSAGYLWSVSVEDEAAFEVSENYLPQDIKEGEEPQIGSATTKVFNLKTLKEGSFEVTFTNARPFDETDKQALVFKVDVKPN